MIPLPFEQNFDRSLLTTVEADSWTIPSASAVFPLTAAAAASSIDGCIAVVVALTIVGDDRLHLSWSREERTETVVKALPSSPRPAKAPSMHSRPDD